MVSDRRDRRTAETDGGFVVYVNGIRLNGLRAVGEWVAAGRKLAATFDRLEADPDSGFLGYTPAFRGLRTGAAIQYCGRSTTRSGSRATRTAPTCPRGGGTKRPSTRAGASASGPNSP